MKVLCINASLKNGEPSNTEDLMRLVVKEMGGVEQELIVLSKVNLPHGIEKVMSKDDGFATIAKKIAQADAVIFGTPVWWGSHSSLMQRLIERMDSIHEEYLETGRTPFYAKPAGIVITGHEDGAMQIMAHLMMVFSWMGFMIPPEGAAYWTGEVGIAGDDADKRRKNKVVQKMAKRLARNLLSLAGKPGSGSISRKNRNTGKAPYTLSHMMSA